MLTIAANGQNWWYIRSLPDGAALRVAPLPPPAFSKVADGLVFRNAAIQNSFENAEDASRLVCPRRAGDRQKRWLSRTANHPPSAQILIGSDCEHKAPLASTARRWRAHWQIMCARAAPHWQLIRAGIRYVGEHERRCLRAPTANVCREPPLIARRPHFDCAPLQLRAFS